LGLGEKDVITPANTGVITGIQKDVAKPHG
jgi:hypothetical protein